MSRLAPDSRPQLVSIVRVRVEQRRFEVDDVNDPKIRTPRGCLRSRPIKRLPTAASTIDRGEDCSTGSTGLVTALCLLRTAFHVLSPCDVSPLSDDITTVAPSPWRRTRRSHWLQPRGDQAQLERARRHSRWPPTLQYADQLPRTGVRYGSKSTVGRRRCRRWHR